MAAPTVLFTELLSSNRTPTDDERQEAVSLLQIWSTEAAVLAAKVQALQAELAQESVKLKEIQERIRLHSSIVSPLRSVPAEILQHIFRYTLPESHNALLSPDEAPIILTRVCRVWRVVALSTPELWSSIHIVCTPFDKDMPQRSREIVELRLRAVESWLARSGTCLLDISIRAETEVMDIEFMPFSEGYRYSSTVLSALRAIIPHSRRWSQLSIVATMGELKELLPLRLDLPELQSFVFRELGRPVYPGTDGRFQPFFLSSAQKLQRASLIFPHSEQLRSLAMLPSRDIVDLRIHTQVADVTLLLLLHRTIRHCARLQRLHVHLVSRTGSIALPSPTSPPACLADLVTVELRCYSEMAASILNCISAPCLDYLALQMNHVRPPESRALMEFLARSHAPLRKLRVKTDGAYFVNDCLPYMPALEDLAILRNHGDRNTLWGQEQEVFVSVLHHHWPLVCPLLQTIELDRCAGVDDEWLSRFLRARTDRGSSRGECALRSVKVRFLEPQPSLREVAETTPFTVEGVEVHVRWDEWRPARTYSPGLGASEEEIVNVCEEDRA